MKKYEFKVRKPTGFLVVLCVSYTFVVLMFLAPVILDLGTPGFKIICSLCAFGAMFIAYSAAMKRIKVNGFELQVRTALGKRYTIECADIQRIECLQMYSGKRGLQQYITVTAKQCEFRASSTDAGFSDFAGYLLDQLEVGEIMASAASKSCQKNLRIYWEGEKTQEL